MTSNDPYEILGVAKSASADEIKRAYRRLAKEHHPDRNPGDKKAEARFKEIQAAYDVLGDAERRSQFDQFGAGGPRPDFQDWARRGSAQQPFEGVNSVDFENLGDFRSIFEAFFSRGGPAATSTRSRGRRSRTAPSAPPPPPRPAAPAHTLEIEFEEAARGTTRELLIHGPQPDPEHIEVHIPRGVADGQVVRVKGKGAQTGGDRGDLLIRIRVRPHAYFRREGLDVLLDLPLSIPEAILGAKIDIPTLDGRAQLTIPAGATSGMRLRLRGRGFSGGRNETGDMYAVLKIAAPREPSDRLKELIQSHADEFGPDPRAALRWGT